MSKSIVSWIGCASDVRKVTRVLFHRHEVCQPRGNLMNIEQSSENARPKQRHDGEADCWPLQWRCRHLWRWYCQHRNSDEQLEHLSNCQICIKNFFAKKNFDKISQNTLWRNLRKKDIPGVKMGQIRSFIVNKSNTTNMYIYKKYTFS